MIVHDDPLFRFELDGGKRILKFLWSPTTTNMTDDDFKRALLLYADFAEKFLVQGLLVDVRDFKHALGSDVGKWRDATIVPRYVRAGVKKLAYVVGDSSPMPSGGSKKNPSEEPVATNYFGASEDAERWLSADSG